MEFFRGDPESRDAMWCMECASVERFCVGRGLDPGAGGRTLRPDIVRLDVRPERRPHVRGHAGSLPFRDRAFDFVFTCHLLEHIADTRAAIAEWLRVVRVGGHVVIVLPNTLYTLGQNTDPTPHLHEWSPTEFVTQLSANTCCVDFRYAARHALTELNAKIVFADEACPRWSFAVVLEKLGDNRKYEREGGVD